MQENTSLTTDAIRTLGLTPDDPVIALYQGIELFEQQAFQLALAPLITACLHYQLHAVPYLEYLLSTPSLKIEVDAAQKDSIGKIKVWSGCLHMADIGHKNMFHASQGVIEIQKEIKKESQKKTKKKKLRSDLKKTQFLRDEQDCGHRYYLQAQFKKQQRDILGYIVSLCSAANHGHLFAISEFVRRGKIPTKASIFAQELINNHLKKTVGYSCYSEEVFSISTSHQDPRGKGSFHFESVLLGAPSAFGLVASLYFFKKKLIRNMIPLVAIGVRMQDATSRIFLLEIEQKYPSLSVAGLILSDVFIAQQLSLNLIGDYHHDTANYHMCSDIGRVIQTNTINNLTLFLSKLPEESPVFQDDDLVTAMSNLTRTLGHDDEELFALYSGLNNIYTKRVSFAQDPDEKIAYSNKMLPQVLRLWEKTQSIPFLFDLFYITLENYEIHQNHSAFTSEAHKLELLTQIEDYVKRIEQHFGDQISSEAFLSEHLKFIKYAYRTYAYLLRERSDQRDRKTLTQQHRNYLQLAASCDSYEHLIFVAKYHMNGQFEFEKNFQRARDIFHRLPKEYFEQEETIRLLALCYFADPDADSDQGVSIILRYVEQFPILLYELGDFYCDGFIGIKSDAQKAITYYQMAIDHDVMLGHLGIGLMKIDQHRACEDQKTKHQLRNEIIDHLRITHEAGFADGSFFLGKIYLFGMAGIPRNLDKSKQYLTMAVERNGHDYARALLAMIDAGYSGEENYPIFYEQIKMQSLMESGYIDSVPAAMFEYGILCLYKSPREGISYINKAARFNDTESIYLLSILQFLQDREFFMFDAETNKLINQHNCRHLIDQPTPIHMIEQIKSAHGMVKLFKKYLDLNYLITPEFAIETFLATFTYKKLDLLEIEQIIKEHFPSETVLKTRLLVQKQEKSQRSGDETCRLATLSLLNTDQSGVGSLQKKLSRYDQDSKLSMKNFSDCLSAFLKMGVHVEGTSKKAIQAAAHIHPPHGKDRNHDQDLEAGRKQTALTAISEMLRKLTNEHPVSRPDHTGI